MPSSPAFYQVICALEALRHHEPVTLETPGGAMGFMAAESWMKHKPDAKNLVLSAPRSGYLGWGDKALSIPLSGITPAEVETLAFASHAAKPASLAPASVTEQHALALLKASGCLPAAIVLHAVPPDGPRLLQETLAAYFRHGPPVLNALPEVRLPVEHAQDSRAVGFTDEHGHTHVALLIGAPEREPAPLVRLHSSCVTGDVLGSLRCDCGAQLHGAMRAIIAEGSGVLLYLSQEGRGIGLSAKLRAYALQDAGLDTVDANRALGFADDERDFALAAHMLKHLGISAVRLLTNNPEKCAALEAQGITIKERVGLFMPHEENRHYLDTKKARLGHQF